MLLKEAIMKWKEMRAQASKEWQEYLLMDQEYKQLLAKFGKPVTDKLPKFDPGFHFQLKSGLVATALQSPTKVFYYPDGTTASQEPKDGETFIIVCKGGSKDVQPGPPVDSQWQWNQTQQRWIKIYQRKLLGNGQPIVHIGIDHGLKDEEVHQYYNMTLKGIDPLLSKNIICECGSEKVNSPVHSSWCPKYNG